MRLSKKHSKDRNWMRKYLAQFVFLLLMSQYPPKLFRPKTKKMKRNIGKLHKCSGDLTNFTKRWKLPVQMTNKFRMLSKCSWAEKMASACLTVVTKYFRVGQNTANKIGLSQNLVVAYPIWSCQAVVSSSMFRTWKPTVIKEKPTSCRVDSKKWRKSEEITLFLMLSQLKKWMLHQVTEEASRVQNLKQNPKLKKV